MGTSVSPCLQRGSGGLEGGGGLGGGAVSGGGGGGRGVAAQVEIESNV